MTPVYLRIDRLSRRHRIGGSSVWVLSITQAPVRAFGADARGARFGGRAFVAGD